jgi:peptidoglycan hydrolase-like protein with peptidoglycan-binding domain
LGNLSDKDVIEAVRDYKIAHNGTLFQSSPDWKEGVLKRAKNEKADLLRLASYEETLRENGIVVEHQVPDGAPSADVLQHNASGHQALRQGGHGPAVGELQAQLNQLGYTDAKGQPLNADNNFGPSTRAAVEAFQRDNHLAVDGVAGPVTVHQLETQIQVRVRNQAPQDQLKCPARLDDSTHPDNAFYLQTRAHIYRLDQQQGRTPDQRSDKPASALTVAARADGLQRIDRIALSEDASRLWGVERPPGVRDHFFDKHTSVDTLMGLNATMEQSGAQWPQAMQQFQQTQNRAQLQSQTQTQKQDVTQKAAGPVMSR